MMSVSLGNKAAPTSGGMAAISVCFARWQQGNKTDFMFKIVLYFTVYCLLVCSAAVAPPHHFFVCAERSDHH